MNSAPERVTVELQIDTDSHAAPRYLGLSSVAQVSLEYLLPPDQASLIEALLEVADRPRVGVPTDEGVVHWTDCWWAPVPEAGVPGDAKHAGVMVSVNSAELWELAAAPAGFRVYLETREGVDELVQWIAEQVRRPVLGPPEY